MHKIYLQCSGSSDGTQCMLEFIQLVLRCMKKSTTAFTILHPVMREDIIFNLQDETKFPLYVSVILQKCNKCVNI